MVARRHPLRDDGRGGAHPGGRLDERGKGNIQSCGCGCPVAARIRDLNQEKLAHLVYPSGYFNSKGRKLKTLSSYLGERFNDDLDAMSREDTDRLREELLGVYGIGEETADDILLYALGKPTFIVDNYTRRAFSRLGLAPYKARYSFYRSMFLDHLPPDVELFQEYHALIVRHGKEVCRKTPMCGRCPLLRVCPTGEKELAWAT